MQKDEVVDSCELTASVSQVWSGVLVAAMVNGRKAQQDVKKKIDNGDMRGTDWQPVGQYLYFWNDPQWTTPVKVWLNLMLARIHGMLTVC